jgi:hypothetical protein
MIRSFGVVLLVTGLVSCRDYDLDSRLTSQRGLIPADQYARYGREQAEAVAIAREFGHAGARADAAVNYARTLPDVADTRADPLGLLLTIRFKSGWRTMVNPIEDGKRGAETAGLPPGAATRKSP